MTIKIIKLVTGVLQANSYIVFEEETRKGILIDPGWNAKEILGKIKDLKLDIELIVATHLHFDHVGAVEDITNALNIPFAYHEEEESVDYTPINTFAPYFGYGDLNIPRANKYLSDGESLRIGNSMMLRVLHTPGHSPGSITLVSGKHAFVGDLIFAGGVGRTDIPGGDWGTLVKSIKEKIYTLPDNTIIHPGHGMETTVGFEKRGNQFVRINKM